MIKKSMRETARAREKKTYVAVSQGQRCSDVLAEILLPGHGLKRSVVQQRSEQSRQAGRKPRGRDA